MRTNLLESVRAALQCIPASDRDLWLRIGMALHSEVPGPEGFEIFDAWSEKSDTYDARAVRDTWKSFKPGKVTIGTLWHEAKAHGFRGDHPPATAGEQDTKSAERRAAQRAAEEANYRARADKTARDAVAMWQGAGTQGPAPYEARKRVIGGHGVRYLDDGTLLVPVRNAAGEIVNLQRIAAQKPTEEQERKGQREKRFLPGGRKSGCWHLIGDAEAAEVIVVVEGYATACSVHEASGRPVVVAFDAGNLRSVALALAERYPGSRLLIAGDDDRATAERTGVNPGRTKAAAAAKAVGGLAVFPAGLPDGAGSDFNDLMCHAGADLVRAQIEGGVGELLAVPAGVRSRPSPASEPEKAPGGDFQASGDNPPPPGDGGGGIFDRFAVSDEGVFFTEHDQDGRAKSPIWICSRLFVTARTRDGDGDGWGYLLEFDDPSGKVRTWSMPARMLASDGAEYRAALLGMGLRIAAGTKNRSLLTLYLQTRQPPEIAQCTDRIGWHGRSFVLPRETLQKDARDGDPQPERIVYQTEGPSENQFRIRGGVAAWRDNVAALCVGNTRLTFAASCAFAGPLMRPAGLDSGGFHFRGDSSCGKTTALRIAASVYGGPSYLQRWRQTDNHLEAVAAQSCDTVLILDELAQVDPKTAGECAYLLANETGKGRSTRGGQTRPRLTWRLLFLSAGEIGLAAHMAEGGKRARAGQELRMVDIPAEVTQGTIFDTVHGYEGGAVFALHLAKVCETHHGSAGRAFLAWLVDHVDEIRERTRAHVERLASLWVADAASGQVHRVGRRFALVAAAGEMATEAGVTGWPAGEATVAAEACFRAWLAARTGGIGNSETATMRSQVRRFLEMHGAGRFTWWHRAADDHAPNTLMRAGFRRLVTIDGKTIDSNAQHMAAYGEKMQARDGEETSVEYFVLAEVFRSEVCEGLDYQAVCRVLRDSGDLVTGNGGRFDQRARLPGLGMATCYRISPSIFEAE